MLYLKLAMRIIEILLVMTITVLGVEYTFRFGNLIAMDHMAGILGVPFLIFLMLFCGALIFSKSRKVRNVIRIILACYLLTLILYSVTILTLRSSMDNVFEGLYSANGGSFSFADKLLAGYCISGMTLTAIILYVINGIKKGKSNTELLIDKI